MLFVCVPCVPLYFTFVSAFCCGGHIIMYSNQCSLLFCGQIGEFFEFCPITVAKCEFAAWGPVTQHFGNVPPKMPRHDDQFVNNETYISTLGVSNERSTNVLSHSREFRHIIVVS